MAPEEQICDLDPCVCAVLPAEAVRREGNLYCSERCAEGRGCDHAGCNCGDYPEPEPEL